MVPHEYYVELFREEEEEEDDNTGPEENNGEEIFEVPKVIDMRYNDPKKEDKHGLYFKANRLESLKYYLADLSKQTHISNTQAQASSSLNASSQNH
ncbi:hypothetical protein MtrunA17_Chr8g0364101 [Medicago truncatula]|uniref:Uncharacterized protein n=1 Tax=Medicago truncatula TaxID=3880 RepID=A0A396GJH8_MEDTR|nr:hypothetical protein MtrunA17_Chr8g0364101 [Medicago truncatula]